MEHNLGSERHPIVVAIVGSGPSGFYAAEALLKAEPEVRVNIIERLPVPYGLVRYGVAPDHPKLKMVSIVFQKIAEDPRVRFFGNVALGHDVSLDDLKATHHAVILCNGSESDRRLGIPGEDLSGSHTATEFVAWYNGHPDYAHAEFDLSHDVAVVIGQGNVAADVARILTKPVDELRSTDITTYALDQLAESRVREVHIIGRRGPVQAKFTGKELRELGELQNCSTTCGEDGFQLGPSDELELAEKTNDNLVKCFELFKSFGHVSDSTCGRQIRFHFLMSPVEMIGVDQLEGIRCVKNHLSGEANQQTTVSTGVGIDIPCGISFKSIGYRGCPVANAPFDDNRGIIPNNQGRVVDDRSRTIPGLYVSGWIKRGPSGIIGTNKADSTETVGSLLADMDHLTQSTSISFDNFPMLLDRKKHKSINYEQWGKIDALEIEHGHRLGKQREKVTSIPEMLEIAGQV